MRISKHFLLTLLLIIITVSASLAQEDVLRPRKTKNSSGSSYMIFEREPFIIGLEVGANYNFFAQDLNWNNARYNLNGVQYEHPSAYESHANAKDFGLHWGIFLDAPLGKKFNLSLRFDYDERKASNDGTGFDYNYDPVANVFYVDQKRFSKLDWSVNSEYYGLGFLLRYDINDNFFVSGGLLAQFLKQDVYYTQDITMTDGTKLDNIEYWHLLNIASINGGYQDVGQYSAASFKITPSNTITSRLGIELGLGYKIPIAKDIWLVPQGRFQYFFTKFIDDDASVWANVRSATNRSMNGLQLTLGLWFGI